MDEVIVEIRDGISLKPIRKFDGRKLEESFREYLDKLRKIMDLVEPKPGELPAIGSGSWMVQDLNTELV